MRTMTMKLAEMPRSRTVGESLNHVAAAMTKLVVTWWRQRRTEHALSQLSDHSLDDIGVIRSEITPLAEKLAREDRHRLSARWH